VQNCVVTLEPIAIRIDVPIQRRFLPSQDTDHKRQVVDVFVDPEAEDPPEELGSEIDLGAVIIEELALNVDPYPRKEGSEFAEIAPPEVKKHNPFAALAKLKKGPEGQK
jgi:uncharacterized metal-binding protein YceD (DUF177 family)